jgi:serine/threonine protein kinase
MDRYECFEKIGEGAFGVVFAASKKSTGEKVREYALANSSR